MSKPRYDWYGNVIRVIRYYPAMRRAKDDLQAAGMTADYSGMPRGGGGGRATESRALRTLSPREEEELDAVALAIETVGARQDGAVALRVVEMVDWCKTHTIAGAAYTLHVSEHTARRLRSRFVFAVSKNLRYF